MQENYGSLLILKLKNQPQKVSKLTTYVQIITILYDKHEIANEFNNFYNNIDYDLASKIKNKNNFNISLSVNLNKSFYITPTTAFEITKIIQSIPEKAGEIDYINVKTLKHATNFIAGPQTQYLA